MNKFRKPHGNNRDSGKFGGGGYGGRDNRPGFTPRPAATFDRRDDRREKQLFDATCSHCGKACEVPFRPNGKKPVFCKDCFNSDRTGVPPYGSRPEARQLSPAAPRATGAALEDRRIDELKRQVDALHVKMDRLMAIVAKRDAPAEAGVESPNPAEKEKAATKKKAAPAKKKASKKK